MSGSHFDEGKPRVDLLDPDALLGLARVLSFGADKYTTYGDDWSVLKSGTHNWRGGIKYSRIIGSILRHLFAVMQGEDIDSESGLPHIDHLGCDWMFLSHFMKNRKDLDDRHKPDSKLDPERTTSDTVHQAYEHDVDGSYVTSRPSRSRKTDTSFPSLDGLVGEAQDVGVPTGNTGKQTTIWPIGFRRKD